MFLSTKLSAQTSQKLSVLPISFVCNGKPLKLGETYISSKNDTFTISQFKFYLTVPQENNVTETTEPHYFLIDLENPESHYINLSGIHNKGGQLTLYLGVDSVASVSGARGGALDPTNGMYWAWQSGYINLKVEGNSPSAKTRKNQFQFHIGGYLSPNYAFRKVSLPISKPLQNQTLVVDIGVLFNAVSLKETNSIMIPGQKAMELATICTKIISLQ